jgi:WD40 repeat protein/tRNA A-37 threonylcarbamoyl transferase component Bud32
VAVASRLPTLAEFVDHLGRYRCLDATALQEVRSVFASRFPEPRALAKELLRRAWLTPYQANQLLQGKGPELLLGSYVLLERLGGGGMGQVFKARNWKLGQTVAIKVIRKDRLADPEMVRRFRREIRAAAQLDHPHIVRALDADEVRGTHLFVMEYVEGIDLAQLVKEKGPLPVAEACDYVRQAALGLQHAFERGLVHRDVKPHNLLLTPQGVVKLLDLGLARLEVRSDGEASSTVTGEGAVMGTPDYIAPEQATDARTADIRADLYGLGCTLFFLLTGRVPFPAGTFIQKINQHQFEPPPAVEQLRPGVPPAVATLVRKLMAKRPEDRLQTPAELAAALDQKALVEPPPPPARPPASVFADLDAGDDTRAAAASPRLRTSGRGRWVLLAGLGSTLMLAALGALALWPTRGPPGTGRMEPPQDPVQAELSALLGRIEDPQEDRNALRAALVDFQVRHGGTAPALRAAEAVVRLPSPLDRLRREDIPAYELEAAGDGDPARAPARLVAVLGDSRLKHWGPALYAVFSPDSQTLATGGADGTIRFWDVATGRQRRCWSGKNVRATSVSFPATGPLLAFAEGDGPLRLVEAETGKERHLQTDKPDRPTALALRADGRMIACLYADGGIRLWDTAGGGQPKLLRAHEGELTGAAFTPDGKRLATASRDGTVRLWDTATGEVRRTFRGVKGQVFCVGFHPEGELLACGGNDSQVHLWNGDTGEEVRAWKQDGYVAAVGFSADGRLVATGTHYGELLLWEAATGQVLRTLPRHWDWITGVAFSPDGQRLASTSLTGEVKLYATATGEEVPAPAGQQPPVPAVAVSPDGRLLATGSWDRTVKLWDTSTGAAVRSVTGCPNAISCVAFRPDSRMLAAGGTMGAITAWEVETGRRLPFEAGHDSWVYSLAFRADGRMLASSGYSVILWPLEPGEKPRPLHVREICTGVFPARGPLLAVRNGIELQLWDTTTGQVVRTIPVPDNLYFTAVAFRPDGEALAAGMTDGTLRLWNTDPKKEKEPPRRLPGHPGASIASLAYRIDGRVLASAAPDGTVRLWDPQAGKETEVLRIGPAQGVINQVVCAPDGRHVVTANSNGTVYILRLSSTARPGMVQTGGGTP